MDRQGRISPLAAPVRTYRPELRVSPNGRQLAVPIRTLTEIGLWLYDLDRSVLTPLTRRDEATWPLWSPDGRHIVLNWLHDGRYALARQSADGSTPAEALSSGWFFRASSWTRPGQVVGVLGPSDLGIATLEDKESTLEPLLQTPDFECCPDMSPDGRWLAYQLNSSGRSEIYVQSHPGPGARTQVSLEGGFGPAWHRNGREMYLVSPLTADGRRRMMAAAFAPGVPPRPGRPQVLFEFNPQQLSMLCRDMRCYDVSPDGQRFYAVQVQTPSPQPPVTQINFVQNWTEELKAKVPVK